MSSACSLTPTATADVTSLGSFEGQGGNEVRTDLGTDSEPHPVHCRLNRYRSIFMIYKDILPVTYYAPLAPVGGRGSLSDAVIHLSERLSVPCSQLYGRPLLQAG